MKIPPYDAWVLRRLLVGESLNGELQAVSHPFRGVADRLNGLDPETRQAALDDFLAGQDDAAVIITAMAAANPCGLSPLPEGTAEAVLRASSVPSNEETPPRRSGTAKDWPRLRVGKIVYAKDRGNFGTVVKDLGDRAQVYFISQEGYEAEPILPKSILLNQDQSPLSESAESGVGWGPLPVVEIPPVEPFPVDVLPEAAARLVREGAAAIGCPVDFLSLSVLAVAGGVVGRSVNLRLKDGYDAGPTVFACLVGPPSDGKSPAIRKASAPVMRIEARLAAEHAEGMDRWRESSEQEAPQEGKKKAKPPPPPKPRRIVVDDVTMEAMPGILAANPRGLIRINDELSALVSGMNQYKGGKGNDRSILLAFWSGEAVTKDRVGQGNQVTIRCPHPSLAILGGMTPDMLGSLIDPKARSDGFVERFLFAFPDPLPVPRWTSRGVPKEVSEDWFKLVCRLWERQMAEERGRPVPHVANFDEDGGSQWENHYNAHSDEMNDPDFSPALRGTWGKLREYAGRLALTLACLRHASDPLSDPQAVPTVGALAVDHAWALVGYFKSHVRRVHAVIAGASWFGGGPVVKVVVDWLRDSQRTSFSLHEIKQARRTISDATLTKAFKALTERGVIRPRPAEPRGGQGGRPPSPVYDVNPALLETQNPRNARNPDPDEAQAERFEGSEGFEDKTREAT